MNSKMRLQRIHSTSQHMKLSTATLDCLRHADTTTHSYLLGDISHDGSYGWLARGSFLEAFWMQTGQRLAAWCFGALLKEPTTTITSVCECRFDKGSKLVVATSTINSEGLICLFDAKNSSIMKTIEVPFKVTSLEVVSTVSSHSQSRAVVLSDLLTHYCGILAVGTQCGHVYLIDLCLDDDVDGCDELSPNTLLHVDSVIKDATSKRYSAITRGKHFCLELGEGCHVRGYYTYSKPDNTAIKAFSAENICVSCLKYVCQTGLLVVGMSFGCFQLWRLQETILEYSSRHEDHLAPVTHISFQEPENDPRNFCYLWVAKGPMPSQSADAYTSVVTLFQLGYTKKTWHDDFGYLFEELSSVGPRLEHCLTSDPYNSTPSRGQGSRVISCYTVQDPNYVLSARRSEETFDGSSGPDLSLCAIVWESAPCDPHAKPPAYLSVFDMNRWYHAQMPAEVKISAGSYDVCPFFAMCSLDGVQQKSGTDDIMAIHIKYNSLAKFHSGIIPEPEQHFFPSSLSFDVKCVTESGLVHAKYLGVQRQVLNDLMLKGPSALLEPHDMFTVCQHTGLLPKTEVSAQSLPATYKREAILTMVLEHNLTGFINSCVSYWSSGEFGVVGCTLRFLLEWAWRKVTAKKEMIDRLCISLFDWSGIYLDQQTLSILHQHHRALDALTTIIGTIIGQYTHTTEQGAAELQSKHKVVGLLAEHIGLILWCYDVGLLPEHSDEELGDNVFVYPGRVLADFYIKRRAEIHLLHDDIKSQDVLLIDALTAQLGDPLVTLWEREGSTGQYPPPSIHALLNLCLLENIEQRDKYMMIFYVLCDLLNSAPEELQTSFNDKVRNFSQTYSLPLGLSKLVQGMWLLDHKDFEDSLFYLLDPSVQTELTSWQHTRILKALLYQGKNQLAQQYLKVRRPPLTGPEDVKLKLTVLLANGLTAEAFDYQRLSRDKNNVQDLLSHVFLGCQQTKTVDQLLLLPFTEEEELHLVTYMKASNDTHCQELLVLYYLLRARYVEAFRLNNRVKQQTSSELDPKARERTRVRNSLVDGYYKVLPSIQRKLCFGPDRPIHVQQHMGHRKEIPRPAPLSTVVNKMGPRQALTRAALLQSVLDKVMEVKQEDADDNAEEQVSIRVEVSPSHKDVPGPFICTPMTPRVRKQSRLTEVVFPASVPSNRLQPQDLLYPSTRSPRAVHSPFVPKAQGTVSPLSLSGLSSTLKRKEHLSSEALTLLKTPPVKRRTPCRDRLNVLSNATTPQSILKVRSKPHVPSQSPGPPPVPIEKLNFQTDIGLPTPPRIQRRVRLGSTVKPESRTPAEKKDLPAVASELKSEQMSTSKHLRFASLPQEPVVVQTVRMEMAAGDGTGVYPHVSPRKSLHDRTPSPERPSAQTAAQSDETVLESMNVAPSTPPGEAALSGEDEDIMVIDDEVTFNFGGKQNIRDVDNEESDVIHDTESFDAAATSPVIPKTGPVVVPDVLPMQADTEQGIQPVTEPHVVYLSSESNEPVPLETVVDIHINESDEDFELKLDSEDVEEDPVEPDGLDFTDFTSVQLIENHIESTCDTQHVSDSIPEVDRMPSECEKHATSHMKIVSKSVHEEGQSDEQVLEFVSDHKVTQIIKTTMLKKTVTENVKLVESETESEVMITDSEMHTDDHEMLFGDDRNVCTEVSATEAREKSFEVRETHKAQVETETHLADSISQSMEVPDSTSTENKTSRSLQRSGSRRGRKTSESLPTPTRRSSRTVNKTRPESTDGESGRTTPQEESTFKTPPRSTKSQLPPTPPKSNASSPTSSASFLDHEPTTTQQLKPPTNGRRSRSRSKSPTSTTESGSKMIGIKARRGRPPISPATVPSPDSTYMMKLRKTQKSLSRETTPDSTHTLSDHQSLASDDFEKPDFTFSNPLAITDAQDSIIPSTPVHPFIFSPPITRSRRRESMTSQRSIDTSLNSSLLADTSLVLSPAKNTRASKKRDKVVKPSEPSASPSDSTINFLSPIKESELHIPQRVTRQKAKTGFTKYKSLRTRAAVEKKRKPIQW